MNLGVGKNIHTEQNDSRVMNQFKHFTKLEAKGLEQT